MKTAVKFFVVASCVAQVALVFAARKGTIDWANRPDSPAAKIKGYLPVFLAHYDFRLWYQI